MIAVTRPRVDAPEACTLAEELFALSVTTAEVLPSERDANFLLEAADGSRYVLKVSAAGEERALLELQHAMLDRLADDSAPYRFPRPRPTPDGDTVATATLGDREHLVRLLVWIDGEPLAHVRPRAPELLEQLGGLLGWMHGRLEGLECPAARRTLAWDLTRAAELIAERAGAVADPQRRKLLERLTARCAGQVAGRAAQLRRAVLHNDANDHNVLVGPLEHDADGWPRRTVVGLLDFGDAIDGWVAAEPAVAAAYGLLGRARLIDAVGRVAAGFHQRFPLREAEIEAIFPLAVLRLCLSVANSAVQAAAEPEQRYLRVSEAAAWEALERIDRAAPELAVARVRHACGLEPCAGAAATRAWLRRQGAGQARPVVGPPLERAFLFDLAVGSWQMGGGAPGAFDTAALSERLFGLMRRAGAAVGIGRYDEARCWYGGELFAAPADEAPRRRTVHLGVDLFLQPGSEVFAPLAGRVVSARVNPGRLDYGPTVILEHEPERGVRFRTLYGHLQRDSIAHLRAGERVAAGARIGRIGAPPENGDWPPHLHFQVFVHPLGHEGDFPGVAAPDERDFWLAVCPDPGPLLGLQPKTSPPEGMSCEGGRHAASAGERARPLGRAAEAASDRPVPLPATEILRLRRRHLGPSLSISYRRPLHIVRGFREFLYDADGQPFLDAVNNVPHVGHAHPRVVAAAAAQEAVLNTNTRYLHENLVRYAARLAALFPDPLEVCYLVCTGSEANELAIRLARAHTGRRDLVVFEGAYHGNTTTLIDVSPYKHAGPGGAGPPAWVHVAAMPDPYRGRHRGADEATGRLYAQEVGAAADRAVGGVAALLAEPLLGCGGQIVPPPGFLPAAFAEIRARGGVCIADEVQIGFGRVGTHRWAFEALGSLPDIVTLGKPMGNGYPLAAVITTRAIADSFATGMEYFNTFGGNPVACAVGMAVLDVLEQERLQDNARRVGERLLAGLRQLAARHEVVGDVRGLGLYVGVEMVADRDARTPAAQVADYVVNRAREHGVLISTDGPDHNVLKIKPPLCFADADADRLLEVLERILGEDACRPIRAGSS